MGKKSGKKGKGGGSTAAPHDARQIAPNVSSFAAAKATAVAAAPSPTHRHTNFSSSSSSSRSSSPSLILSDASSTSTSGTTPTHSLMLPRKGWSSAQSEMLPRPVHVDPLAPLSREHLPSWELARRTPERSFDLDPEWVPFPDDPYCLRHSEFGHDVNEKYRWTSAFRPPELAGRVSGEEGEEMVQVPVDSILKEDLEEPGYWVYLSTYFSYLILIVLGHIRDFFGKRFASDSFKHFMSHNGYAALTSDFDSFYTRRLKARMDDCFSRPVTGLAGRTITLIDRASSDHCLSFEYTGTTTQALNISSYNYLGFAQSRGGCAEAVGNSLESLGITTPGAREDVGTHALHVSAEKLVARFVGSEAALIISQGFATNATVIPAIMGKGSLIISDELNHASIRFGGRLSGAMVRQFKHNDMKDLEALLRDCVSQGQPRTHRPWKKILVMVEGIYSMEGTVVNLPALLALKQRYKFYLYVDEAHSIGALGPRGRGVCDYFGVDPQQVDILMGTFTKSFGAAGGYIAGSESTIANLRLKNHSSVYAESMPLPVTQQIVASLASIMGPECLDVVPSLLRSLSSRLTDGEEGRERLRRLAFNARYLHTALRKLGFIVYGNKDSPIVPLLIFNPGKMLQFSRLMLERYAIVVVVVAYPATPLVSSRVRFCLSAAHTKEDIDRILIATDDIGGILGLKIGTHHKRMSISDVISRASELAAEP